MLIFSLLQRAAPLSPAEHAAVWLAFKREFTDFVEENRPSVPRLETRAGLGFYGSREGTLRVTEQIASNQRRNQRAAIDGYQTAAAQTRPGNGWRAQPILSPFPLFAHKSATGVHVSFSRPMMPQDFTDLADSPMIPVQFAGRFSTRSRRTLFSCTSRIFPPSGEAAF